MANIKKKIKTLFNICFIQHQLMYYVMMDQ